MPAATQHCSRQRPKLRRKLRPLFRRRQDASRRLRRRWYCSESGFEEPLTMDDVVIVAALRTAVGKFGGTISGIPASELGAKVISALLQKTGVKPEMVSEVLMGQV